MHTVCMYNIYIYIHACVSIMCHQTMRIMYIYIFCYPQKKKKKKKNYIAPPQNLPYNIYIYIFIHDHDYICQRARFPQLPLLCFLVMLPVEQPLLTNGCSPTLGLLLMTSSFPCSTSYICPIYISKRGVNWYHDLSMSLFYNLLIGPSTR